MMAPLARNRGKNCIKVFYWLRYRCKFLWTLHSKIVKRKIDKKIFVLPVELLIVGGERRWGETLLRVQEGIQAPQVELVQHALLLAVPWDHCDKNHNPIKLFAKTRWFLRQQFYPQYYHGENVENKNPLLQYWKCLGACFYTKYFVKFSGKLKKQVNYSVNVSFFSVVEP